MIRNSSPANRRALWVAWLLSPAAAWAADTDAPTFGFDDFLLAPLRIHLLTSKDAPHIATTLKDSDITRILGKINKVWAQAGIHFYLESLIKEAPKNAEQFPHPEMEKGFNWLPLLRPMETEASNTFHLYYLKRMPVNGVCLREGIFVKDTASLRDVPGGIDEPIPRVSSHELGHAFGLPHRQNRTNLMASGTTGTWLNAEEIKRARANAQQVPWIETASAMLKRADEWAREGKFTEAKKLYQHVGGIPLNAEQVERARKRASESASRAAPVLSGGER